MVILDGKEVSKKIRAKVQNEALILESKTGIKPHLAVILVGHDPASETYVSGKQKACASVGLNSTIMKFEETCTQDEVLDAIHQLNKDPLVHGILLQLPIPKHLNQELLMNAIEPKKDVDGFTHENVSRLLNGLPSMVPCTPKGILTLLNEYQINVASKHVVIIGRSQIVGRPLIGLMLKNDATVTVCHSKTQDLKKITQMADILIVAIGKKEFVDASFIKDGCIVIDVGINRVDGKLYGDVLFDSVIEKVGFITPVPKGVGPMTIASLLENTLICYQNILGVRL